MRIAVGLAVLLGAFAARAAEPINIGISTVLSGPTYDRGQSEQYGAQLAINQINQAGGVLGRPLEAYYSDNQCKPPVGIAGVKRLIEQDHVPVVIGALCTPVTHAIMPVMQEARVPLIIATSAGQDFVDASGVGGNDFAFKTIPSEVDITRGLAAYLASQKIASLAIVTDAGRFFEGNGASLAQAAQARGMKVTAQVGIGDDKDYAGVIAKLRDGNPEALALFTGPSSAGLMKALEASGWKVTVTGRVDPAMAMAAVSESFRPALAGMTSAGPYSNVLQTPGVQDFVRSYQAHYGIMPTQRAFFVYEATLLAADAIARAGSTDPVAVQKALKASSMPSMLGSTYTMDDHNHPNLPIVVVGVRDGKPAVVATMPSKG